MTPHRAVSAGVLTLCGASAALLTLPLLKGGAWWGWGSGRDEVPDIQAFVAFVFPFALAEVVHLRWTWLAGVLHHELSAERFGEQGAALFGPRGAEVPARRGTARFRRISRRIREEQHAPLVMYRPENPFCGVGVPNEPWSLSVELRPREGHSPGPVDNRTILRHLVPTLERLRTPSTRAETDAVRDRLRGLEIEEVVFLPVEGLPARDIGPQILRTSGEHRTQAVEEGGEARRYYLRISVVGWSGELVVTVFVRVHTQGGILVLELVPYTLHPVKAAYRRADREAREWRRRSPWDRTAWVFRRVPGATFAAPVTLVRLCVAALRGAGRVPQGASPAGVNIGTVHGVAVVGDHNTVTCRNPSRTRELRLSVRQLRAELAERQGVAGEGGLDVIRGLDRELADAEDELTSSGAASPARLARLRQALADAGAVTATMASAVAVGQAVGALLGG
ncbi:hypothetical protein [Streptomyces sp. WZ.A104]|uniref:hypothetical protein n=1 Tax=Streptomyces sp. WZ.A104 TaxID=2023771 RepID=UPI00211C691A|nr:hypothetical protein [Streptomyces sp. WZ.A104]